MVLKPAPTPALFQSDNATRNLIDFIATQQVKKLLIMTSEGLVKLQLIEPCLQLLEKKGITYQVFDGVEPNPSFTTVSNAIERFHQAQCDGVLAFGGGSVIDAAKAVALQIGNNVPLEKLVGIFKARHNAVPFYVIPTTAGTGSEITSSAVLTNPKNHQKEFITDHKTIPQGVALDASTMLGLPAFITADTGMDVLTHAIEAYVSNVSTDEMMANAKNATQLVFKYLPEAYHNGTNINARAHMAKASFEAGMAFNRMGLGFVHAISHQLTSFYGISHGRANAVVLPKVLFYSLPRIAAPLAQLSREIGLNPPSSDDWIEAQQFIDRIEALSEHINIPKGFTELSSHDFDEIAKNARKEAVNSYPVRQMLSHDECLDILEELDISTRAN